MNRKNFLLGVISTLFIGTNLAYAQKLDAPTKAEVLIKAAEGQIGAPIPPKTDGSNFVVNAYQNGLGIDLQSLVNEDMTANPKNYPHNKSSTKKRAKPNQQTANLMIYLETHGSALPVLEDFRDYEAGDLIVMKVNSKPNFAIVTGEFNGWHTQNLVIYYDGKTVAKDDIIRNYPIIARYRFGL